MAHRQSPRLPSLARLVTTLSCRPNRQRRLTTVPQFNHRPILRPRIQKTAPLARTGLRRITGRNRILSHQRGPVSLNRISRSRVIRPQPGRTVSRSPTVRPQPSRAIGRSPIVRRQPNRITSRSLTGMSLLRGPRLLRRTSVRNPNTLLLLPKRDPHRSSNSARSPLPSRKRRSSRMNSRSKKRSGRSNGGLQLGLNTLGILN